MNTPTASGRRAATGRRSAQHAVVLGVVVLVLVTAILLLVGGTTDWLDSVLGIGTHQSSSADLAMVSVTGSARTVLVPSQGMGLWGPTWSPNGTSLVYTLGNPTTHVGPLVLADSRGRGRRILTHDGRSDYLAAWSRDSKRIAYITQQGQDERTADLAVITADGSQARRLTHNRVWEYGASWSPNGRWIAYGSEQGGSWHVWLIHPDGTDAHLLAGTQAGNAPDWSPDGHTIAFTSDRSGNDNIYLIPATGGRARRITTGPCHHDNARWSPDGKQITFATFCAGGWNDIEVMNADGTHLVDLTNTPNLEEEVASWLPDGRHIGFAVYQVNRDGLGPGPVLKALVAGVLVGLLAAMLALVVSRSGPEATR